MPRYHISFLIFPIVALTRTLLFNKIVVVTKSVDFFVMLEIFD